MHPIFITDFVDFKPAHDTIVKWINESDINWSNMSQIVTYSPHNQQFNNDVDYLLENKIKTSSLLVLVLDMYNAKENKFWINKEVEIALKYNKPILATENWNHEDLPTKIQEAPNKFVNWQRDAVINGIKDLLGID